MRLALGIWDHFERRPGVPIADQFQQKIELLQAAEQLGFRGYHIAEHHLTPLDMAPSPNVFLAALAQATSTLRIGSMVHVLPLYHPVRLVQELAMLDHLSRGRLDVGVGRGIRSTEHEWFGLHPAEARARADESLDIIINAFTTGDIAYSGHYYQLPSVSLDVRSLQQPHPPLWYAGGTDTAGQRRFNFLSRTAEEVDRYWSLAQHATAPVNPGEPIAGITRHIVIRHNPAEAMRIARRAWPVYQHNFAATSLRMPDGQVANPRHDFDALLAQGHVLVGTPEWLAETVNGWINHLQARPNFYFAPAVQWGDITFDEALETTRLLAEEVQPALQPAPAAGARSGGR